MLEEDKNWELKKKTLLHQNLDLLWKPFHNLSAAFTSAEALFHPKLQEGTFSTWRAFAFLPTLQIIHLQPGISPASSEKSPPWAVKFQSWNSSMIHFELVYGSDRCTPSVPSCMVSSLRPAAVPQILSPAKPSPDGLSKYFWVLFIAWLCLCCSLAPWRKRASRGLRRYPPSAKVVSRLAFGKLQSSKKVPLIRFLCKGIMELKTVL